MDENIKYEEAVRQIERIVSDMENGKLDIDTLTMQLRTAKQLIKMCRDKLTHTEEEVKQILRNEELRIKN